MMGAIYIATAADLLAFLAPERSFALAALNITSNCSNPTNVFELTGNKPELIEVITEEVERSKVTTATTKRLVNGSWILQKRRRKRTNNLKHNLKK